MTTLLEGCLSTEVVVDGVVRLLLGELAAHREGAEVVCRVAHARILPVDETDVVVLVNQEVHAEEVIVRDARLKAVLLRIGAQTLGLIAQLIVARKVDGAELLEKAFVHLALLPEVKGALKLGAALMQLASHLHGMPQLVGVVCIEATGVLNEPRKLPALLLVLIDEGVVQTQVLRQAKRCLLTCAVNHLLGAHAGVTVDILVVTHRKVAREVGKAINQRVEVMDV